MNLFWQGCTVLLHIYSGLIMVVVGCGLLFWNEGRAVKTAVSLEGEYRYHNPLTFD
jgi:hypothetical protein